MKQSSDPSERWGFLLKDVSRSHSKRFEQRASVFGLTLLQCRALIYLAREEGMSQAQLAAITDMEPMSMVRMLDRMEADGWLERRGNPSDRSTRHLYFKTKGRALLEQINKWVELTRAEALVGISKKQLQTMVDTMDKIRSNLESLEPISVAEPGSRRERRA